MARSARAFVTALVVCLAAGSLAPAASVRNVVVGSDLPGHPLVHFMAARSDSYFGGRRYGIEFRTMGTKELREAFARGEVNVMTASPTEIDQIETARGQSVRLFAPLARWTPGPMILVRADSPVRRLSDLRYAGVAILPRTLRTGHEEAAVLAATGVPLSRYVSMRIRADASDALVRGQVGAAFVEDRARELLATGKFRVVFSVQQAYRQEFADPAVLRAGFLADGDFFRTNRDTVNDLIAATADAWQRYELDPAGVARDGSTWGKLQASALARYGDALQLARFTASDRAVTTRDVRTWQRLYPLLARVGPEDAPAPAAIPRRFLIGPIASRTSR